MKKITELPVMLTRTVVNRDTLGNYIRSTETYEGFREIACVSSGPRLGHFIVDILILQVLYYTLNYLFRMLLLATDFNPFLNTTVEFVQTLILLLFYPGYYFLSEYTWQKSPGKFLTKTVVIDEYGNKPDAKALLFRSLLRLVPFEPFSCWDDNSRGWHDRWSNTWVVTETELAELRVLQEESGELPQL